MLGGKKRGVLRNNFYGRSPQSSCILPRAVNGGSKDLIDAVGGLLIMSTDFTSVGLSLL